MSNARSGGQESGFVEELDKQRKGESYRLSLSGRLTGVCVPARSTRLQAISTVRVLSRLRDRGDLICAHLLGSEVDVVFG